MNGWIKIHRRLSDNPIWTCEPFTRGQAWIDLLMLANYENNFFYIRNIKVDVKRGQVAWSEPKLAERWGWSRTKLRKFLKDLEKEQQLIQQKNNVTQIITITNYEEYQNKEQQEDSKKTAGRRREESKEGKESNNIEWKKKFEIYQEDLRSEFKRILEDEQWIAKQSELNPGIDVRKSIEKSCVNFWGKEVGWKKKKSKKTSSIDWPSTFANAITMQMNRVWKPK